MNNTLKILGFALLVLSGCGKSVLEGSGQANGSNPNPNAPPSTTANPLPSLSPTCQSDAIQTISFDQGDPILTQFLLNPGIVEGVQMVSVDGSSISFSYDTNDGQLSLDASSAGHVGSIVEVTECLYTSGTGSGPGPSPGPSPGPGQNPPGKSPSPAPSKTPVPRPSKSDCPPVKK
jgi:hypothetical protein